MLRNKYSRQVFAKTLHTDFTIREQTKQRNEHIYE